jgi:hypothetical protein
MPRPNQKPKIGMHTPELTNLLARKEVNEHIKITNHQKELIIALKNFKKK